MIKITVLLSLIVCALFLPWTLGVSFDEDTNFVLNDQDVDQEAKRLAQLQNANKRAISLSDERQQPYSALEEIADRDESVNSLDQNYEPLNTEFVTTSPKKGKCWFNCNCDGFWSC